MEEHRILSWSILKGTGSSTRAIIEKNHQIQIIVSNTVNINNYIPGVRELIDLHASIIHDT